MESRLYRGALFALYQVSLLVGIAFLPIALAARRVGVELPLHRLVARLGEAYEHASPSAR